MEIRANFTVGSRLCAPRGIATSVAVLALAALSDIASAQYYPSSPSPYYRTYGAPPLPPEDVDVVELPPAAAPHVIERAPPPGYPPQYEDRALSSPRPPAATEPQVYGRLPPPAPGPRPEEWQGAPRPPGGMDSAHGAGTQPCAPDPPGAVASLPP